MHPPDFPAKNLSESFIFALVFTAIAAFLMIIFNPWDSGPTLPPITDYLAKIVVSLLLLACALIARKSPRFEKYWHVLFALFIMTVAISQDWIFGKHLLTVLGVSDATPAGWALPKLNESFVVISVIMIFTLLSGDQLGAIYIKKGKLKLGLIIGGAAFLIFLIGALPMARLFNAKNLSLARALPWTPWVVLYVLANGAMEKFLFRGLFLRKLQPFVGKFFSVFLLAFIFTGLHSWVSYTADNRIFLTVTFPLALALGFIMQKTDSIWGSILLHAGMDIPIMVGIFSNL